MVVGNEFCPPPLLYLRTGNVQGRCWGNQPDFPPPRTYTAPDIVNLLSGDLSTSGVILAHGHGERLRLVWDVDPSRLDRAGPFLHRFYGWRLSLFSDTPEAVWDWLELGSGDGTPRPQSGGVREQPTKMGNIQSALSRTTRRRRATRSAKVIVRKDGTLSLDRRRQEQEEARLLVRSVTAEVSPGSGSPREDGGLTQDSDSTNA
ncbi:hypothetical protein NDU88_011263 [Pleurodeles waltl]|uniref:Uncharacterized protein n=1 Tax=Pleurodeles waltl TaxID=8319 RepID=A0AAV7Q0T8_PLEWA|nr:hypothetical protein NDU88_011263 [Pleurodeles waltl]